MYLNLSYKLTDFWGDIYPYTLYRWGYDIVLFTRTTSTRLTPW